MAVQRKQGSHERAVRVDLRRLAAEERRGGFAAVALTLARRLDEGGLSSRDLATVSGQFHAIMLTLAKKQQPAEILNPIDELRKRREAKLSDASG